MHLSTKDEAGSLTDDEVSFPSEGNMTQQMRAMMDLHVDLPHQVKAIEAQHRAQVTSSSDRFTTYHMGRRGTQYHTSPTSNKEVANTVRMRVAVRMHQHPLGEESTSDEGLTS